jgi:3'-5' exoribonuclease
MPSAPFWPSESHRLAGVAPSAVVHVAGTVGAWRDRRQLVVESLRVLTDAEPERFLPSIGDPAPWWRLLDGWRAAIRAPRLARVLALVFDEPRFRARFARCPASTMGHHAKLGGLLQHTCEVAHVAGLAAAVFPEADRDLLLAGALLHDLGKLEAYEWRGAPVFTPPGRAIGHVVLGSLLLDRLVHASPDAPCTPLELQLLHHLILSHHGKLEFGAPVPPLTLEAELLHHADQISAKGTSFADALADRSLFPGQEPVSAAPVWQLDRRRPWRARSDWGRPAAATG